MYIGLRYPIASGYDLVLVAYTLDKRVVAKLHDQSTATNKGHAAIRRTCTPYTSRKISANKHACQALGPFFDSSYVVSYRAEFIQPQLFLLTSINFLNDLKMS